MAYAQRHGKGWRSRYKGPDGTWGSESGVETKTAALEWGNDQEALIRRHLWIDPAEAQTPFGTFAEAWLRHHRLAITTRAKYRSHLDTHLLPQWEDWPLVLIFNHHLEIQGWVNELHDELTESTVASVFASFSTVMNVAVRARKIPASPCQGIRVTTGAGRSRASGRHVGAGAAGRDAAARWLRLLRVRAGADGRLHRCPVLELVGQ